MPSGDTPGRLARADGIALVVTLLASAVLLALVGALVPLATTEVTVAANHRRAVEGLYAAEAALEWTVGALAPPAAWGSARRGEARSSVWVGPAEIRLADGARIALDGETAALRSDGAGPLAAGRGRDWRLFAQAPLGGLMPLPAGYGAWRVAVWLAPGPADAVAVHAAAFDPGGGRRAVQALLLRRAPPLPAAGAPAEHIQLLAWQVVR